MHYSGEVYKVSELGPCCFKEDRTFFAKLRKVRSVQPKVKAQSFREFSSRIIKVDYNNENGKCCIRGHANENLRDSGIPPFLWKQY
jgi:hypothetical protein